MNKQAISEKLAQAIVAELEMEDLDPASITPETMLFGEGMGLDSIDAVELVVLVEKHFGVVIKDTEEAKQAFQNFGMLVDFIAAKEA